MSSYSAYNRFPGLLRWETGASFSPLDPKSVDEVIALPEAPVSALLLYPSGYFPVDRPDKVRQPEQAAWIGASGLDGRWTIFGVPKGRSPFENDNNNGNGNGEVLEKRNIRFFV